MSELNIAEEGLNKGYPHVSELTLKKGDVYYRYQVSHILTIAIQENPRELVQKEIDRILSLLPRGAKYVATYQESIITLSIPFVIVFNHPLFEIGDHLEFDYVRTVWENEDVSETKEVLSQGNIFMGVQYLNKDNKPKWPHLHPTYGESK